MFEQNHNKLTDLELLREITTFNADSGFKFSFEDKNSFGCQSGIFARIFAAIFNRAKPRGKYLIPYWYEGTDFCLKLDEGLFFLHGVIIEDIDSHTLSLVHESDIQKILDEILNETSYRLMEWFKENKEKVLADYEEAKNHPVEYWTREEIEGRIQEIIDEEIDMDLEVFTKEITQAVLNFVFSDGPILLDPVERETVSDEKLDESVERVYAALKSKKFFPVFNQTVVKANLKGYLKQCSEMQEPNPYDKEDQRLVKVLEVFLRHSNMNDGDNDIFDYRKEGILNLEHCGLKGIYRLYKDLTEWNALIGGFYKSDGKVIEHYHYDLDRVSVDYAPLKELEEYIIQNCQIKNFYEDLNDDEDDDEDEDLR